MIAQIPTIIVLFQGQWGSIEEITITMRIHENEENFVGHIGLSPGKHMRFLTPSLRSSGSQYVDNRSRVFGLSHA
jgi:hypothetical protein